MAPTRLGQQSRRGDRHDDRLERRDQRGRSGRYAGADATHDAAEITHLGEQAKSEVSPDGRTGQPSASPQQPADGERAGDDQPPGEQGDRGRVFGAEPGADEAGAPADDEADAQEEVGWSETGQGAPSTSHATR